MTETTTPIKQSADDGPELSGVDLPRVALHQAHEAAKRRDDSEARAGRKTEPGHAAHLGTAVWSDLYVCGSRTVWLRREARYRAVSVAST
ncbi:hypothetical protein [Streptomyces sp. NPDC055709]